MNKDINKNINESNAENKEGIKSFLQKVDDNEIISSSFNIFEIFQGNNIFKIKSFQRKYAWNENQIQELINDIEIYESEKNFFLGTIIIKKSKNERQYEYSIVDGQQRITTLFLILKSIELKIINEYHSEDFEDFHLIKKIYMIKNNKDIKNEKLKLEGYRKNTKELEKILKSNNLKDIENIKKEDDSKMKIYIQNLECILKSDIFKNKKSIKNFINKIKHIYFSVILLGKDIDENKVFEDLNSKGSPLVIEDLLRNYFYKKSLNFIKKENPNNLTHEAFIEEESNKIMDRYERSLEKLELFLIKEKKFYRSLFSSKINRFFKNFILFKLNNSSKLNEDNDRRMFAQYKIETKNKIEYKNDIIKELDIIDKYFKFCGFMSDYNSNLKDVEESSVNNEKYFINTLDLYPMIFCFYLNWEEKYFNSVIIFSTIIYINLLIKNIDIWTFLKENLNLIKGKVFDNSKEKKEILNELMSELLYPKQKESDINENFDFWNTFEEDLKNKISDNSDVYTTIHFRRFIQYYFYMQDKNKAKINLVDKKYNLEHIISQNLNLESNLEQIELFNNVNKIQNLCLIEKEINRNFGNENFDDKINIYQKDFIDENKSSQFSSIKDIYSLDNKKRIKEVLEERKQKHIEYVKCFVEEIKNKLKIVNNKE